VSLCEIPTKELTNRIHAVTLMNQSALLELTQVLRTADAGWVR
jgi:hypothetical protein